MKHDMNLISTPYFDELKKIAERTSKIRKDNYALSRSLSRLGFSDCEVLQITETENFLRFRPSEKKECSVCGVIKSLACYHKRKDRGLKGLFAHCRLCRNKDAREYWKKTHKEHPTKNIENHAFKRKKALYLSGYKK